MTSPRPEITFVVPVYNEDAVLHQFASRMEAVLARIGAGVEVLFVNDGSSDGSLAILETIAADSRFRVIDLSRNFGHQVAITAGIDHALGDAVIILDADLQDPPEVALEMINLWRQGYHVVAAKRVTRAGETLFKRASASLFYRFLRGVTSVDIPADVGDYRLLDRCVIEALKAMPERDRYFRGMVSWVGFRQAVVPFERNERAGGETKYTLPAMMRLATNGILGFSDAPLRLALWFGILVSLGALSYGLFVFIGWTYSRGLVQGWTSTVLILSFLGGIQLLTLGIVGLYVGRIHNEVKQRPLYFVTPRHSAGSER
jgi:glycosyltransferase involved in cell wall biosynthesis